MTWRCGKFLMRVMASFEYLGWSGSIGSPASGEVSKGIVAIHVNIKSLVFPAPMSWLELSFQLSGLTFLPGLALPKPPLCLRPLLPQHNSFLNDATVMNHVTFVSIKGVSLRSGLVPLMWVKIYRKSCRSLSSTVSGSRVVALGSWGLESYLRVM